MSYELPKLPYSYDFFEPYIDALTMELHHAKHHAAYVNNLNTLLTDMEYRNPGPIEQFITGIKYSSLPEDIKEKVKFNAGGHYNHCLWWNIISPQDDTFPQRELLNAILRSFESFDNFKTLFEQSALDHLGSGWTWLCVDHERKTDLFICSTSNHDVPSMMGYSQRLGWPILTLDIWEHAYYLKYHNRKAEHVKNFWNIVNWNKVEEYYQSITKGSHA